MKQITFTTSEIQMLIIGMLYANSAISADIDEETINSISDKLCSLNRMCNPENGYKVVAHA